ncbi:sensor histidine kinase [Paenibacillus sp. MBLB4367]|uniref:sensor histidine kinase n=1 Tax=Paenibacillus sp. MBLB4367 TaxID=3384767 RepID=UPI00390843BB
MFRKTLVQLTLRNAAVFLFILIVLSGTLYFFMKQQLFQRVDEQLRESMDNFQVGSLSTGAYYISLPVKDRNSYFLMYNTQGKLVSPLPQQDVLPDNYVAAFKAALSSSSIQTVTVSNQGFRVLPKSVQNGLSSANGISGYVIASNITPELEMLANLRMLLLIGGLTGGLIAVAAGFYLAQRALRPIRNSWDNQQRFVADASHELRTPLAVIRAHTELLLRHPNRTIEQESEYVHTILKVSRRMNKLVDDLLTLARSDSNQLELRMARVRLDSLCEEAAKPFADLAELKEIVLETDIQRGMMAQADEERLHQLLVVLLDNALKYTPERGLVRLTCRQTGHSAVIAVEDTGLGISKEDLPHIFDRFYRGDKVRSHNDGGTGLGLSIVKWIVEKHRGEITVESKPYAGTKMTVRLPL